MTDYQKMYNLLCGAASDALDKLSSNCDAQDILAAQFFLKQGLMRAEDIYIKTSAEQNHTEGQ